MERVARDALGPLGRSSTAMRGCAGWRRHHSMPIEPAPAPMSHSSSPARGASAARVRARISALVSWPSFSNQASSRPGARVTTCASGAPRPRSRRCSGLRRPPRSSRRGTAPHALARPAHRFEDRIVERRSRAREQGGELCGGRPVPGEREDAGARLQMREHPLQGAAMQADAGASGSDQPSRAAARLKAETCGKNDLLRGDEARRARRRRRNGRVAGREHAGRRAASGEDRRVALRDRAGPGSEGRKAERQGRDAVCRRRRTKPPPTRKAHGEKSRARRSSPMPMMVSQGAHQRIPRSGSGSRDKAAMRIPVLGGTTKPPRSRSVSRAAAFRPAPVLAAAPEPADSPDPDPDRRPWRRSRARTPP